MRRDERGVIDPAMSSSPVAASAFVKGRPCARRAWRGLRVAGKHLVGDRKAVAAAIMGCQIGRQLVPEACIST
jgi:hypothetical protein